MRPVRVHPLVWLTAAALALRFLLFLGRGHYVAFDEGWYLLLGRSLMSGEGYTLSGLRHVTLSPLFPVLAGLADRLVGDPVWAGRLVAGIASGLLVVPCWFLFRRLASERAAWIACALVVVFPALAPFTVPFWIGWDLWVGAEPVLHLFLWSGLALAVSARERRSVPRWGGAGVLLALAYLARPEAVIPAGLVGAGLLVLDARRIPLRTAAAGLVLAAGFAVTALPYWIHLHDALGRWTLTGRGVQTPTVAAVSGPRDTDAPSRIIERMLWQDLEEDYVRTLYSLTPDGTRLRSTYWGIPGSDEGPGRGDGTSTVRPGPGPDTLGGAEQPREGTVPNAPAEAAGADDESPARAPPGAERPAPPADPPSFVSLYGRTLGMLVPWYVWLFALPGIFVGARPRPGTELVVSGGVLATGILVAWVVAVDPRTQLLILPVVALYAGRGLARAGVWLEATGADRVRPEILRWLPAALVATLLLGEDLRRLGLSLSLGSPHHIVAEENARVGEVIARRVPPGEPVMSWHPAPALFADRDWHVLPAASLSRTVRYARLKGVRWILLSVFYPSPLPLEDGPAHYLLLEVAPERAVDPEREADPAAQDAPEGEDTPEGEDVPAGDLRIHLDAGEGELWAAGTVTGG